LGMESIHRHHLAVQAPYDLPYGFSVSENKGI
jgi:hypothetical protein